MKNIFFLMIFACLIFSCSSKNAQKQTIDPEKEKIINDWNQFKDEFKSLPQNHVPAAEKISCLNDVQKIVENYEKEKNFANIFHCEIPFFEKFIKERSHSLKDVDFIKMIARKTGVISKFCDSIPTFDEQIEKELFDAILFSGDDSDFECTQRKFKSKPEITFRHFYAKDMSEKKEKFILENMPSDMFSDRQRVKGIMTYLSQTHELERIKKFMKIAAVKKEELGDIGFIYGVMRRNDTTLLDMLFENGFSPHYINVLTQQTLLDSAISNCNPVAVDYLLEKGADPNYRINKMSSPLASLSGCYRIKDPKKAKEVFVKYLIVKGLSVRGKGGEILPMSSLTGDSSLDLLKFMEKHGYDFSYASNVDDYSNPLTESISNKDIQVFDWLISKHGFDVNRPDKDGDTPLQEIVRRMDKKGVKFLIKKGADLNIKNKNGKTPLDIAKERLSQEIQRDKEYKDYLKNKDKKGKKSFKGDCGCETAGDYESDRIKEAREMIELLEKK